MSAVAPARWRLLQRTVSAPSQLHLTDRGRAQTADAESPLRFPNAADAIVREFFVAGGSRSCDRRPTVPNSKAMARRSFAGREFPPASPSANRPALARPKVAYAGFQQTEAQTLRGCPHLVAGSAMRMSVRAF